MKTKYFKLADFLLIAIILVFSIFGLLYYFSTLKSGKEVLVSIDGKEVYSLSLSKDTEKTITSGDNDVFSNKLIIKDGAAFIESANCPDKVCVSHRKISNVGETIICLPHKLVISIT